MEEDPDEGQEKEKDGRGVERLDDMDLMDAVFIAIRSAISVSIVVAGLMTLYFAYFVNENTDLSPGELRDLVRNMKDCVCTGGSVRPEKIEFHGPEDITKFRGRVWANSPNFVGYSYESLSADTLKQALSIIDEEGCL